MTPSSLNNLNPIPGIPKTTLDISKIFTLHYRQANAINTENFYHNGSIQSAHKRGERYCDIMGYNFIYVKPFLSDFSFKEDRKLGRSLGTQSQPENGN